MELSLISKIIFIGGTISAIELFRREMSSRYVKFKERREECRECLMKKRGIK